MKTTMSETKHPGDEIENWTLESADKTVFDNPHADGEWARVDSEIVVSLESMC